MNYNFQKALDKNNGDAAKAEADFRRVAELGGFGSVGDGENQIPVQYPGGLDLYGVMHESNTAVSAEAKKELANITGVSLADVAKHVTTSSADRIGVDGNKAVIDTSAADAAMASSESKKGR